jgi:putative peptidoglycan lipid II flippase
VVRVMKSPYNIVKIVGFVALINLLARLFGFVRELVIGFQFGTSYLADSVVSAYTIPNFLYVVIGGAITTAFISVYGKITNPIEQQHFKESVFTALSIILIFVLLSLALFAKPITAMIFPGLDGRELSVTSQLLVLMAPSSLFLVFSMWFSGVLNVHRKFKAAALSTLLLNAVFVLLAVVLFPLFGIYAHGIGALVGSIVMAGFLFVILIKSNVFSLKFRLKFTSDHSKRMLRLVWPIILGGATMQFYFLIHRVFASTLEDGFVAALNYSSKLVQLPQGVLMTAVATVIYPALVRKASDNHSEVENIYQKGLRTLALTVLPISIFVLFYAREMVELVFEHGQFTSQSTAMTAPLLKILVIAMFAHAANLYITRFFYAKESSKLPVFLSVLSVFGINVLFIFLLIEDYGAQGVAWATSISAVCNFVLLAVAAHFTLGLKLTVQSAFAGLKLVLLLTVFTIIVLLTSTYVSIDSRPVVTLIIGAILSIIVFFFVMKWLKFPEASFIETKLRAKVRKKNMA